jgi:hypothetical protein
MNGGKGLGLNVDVSNTAFWAGSQDLYHFINNYLATLDTRFANARESCSIVLLSSSWF